MDMGKAELLQCIQRFFKEFIRFTGKSQDQVRRNRQMMNTAAQGLNETDEFLFCIFTVHRFQYGIRSRLERQVQMRTDAVGLVHDIDEFIIDFQ